MKSESSGLLVLLIDVGTAVTLVTKEVLEVMVTELVELLGPTVVELDSTLPPSVVVVLGFNFGISAEVVIVAGPSSALATKRTAAVRSRHRHSQSSALTPEAFGNMVPSF